MIITCSILYYNYVRTIHRDWVL